jgi:hypothetical protein
MSRTSVLVLPWRSRVEELKDLLEADHGNSVDSA